MSERTEEQITTSICLAAQNLDRVMAQLEEKKTGELMLLKAIYIQIICQNARQLPNQPGKKKMEIEVATILRNHPERDQVKEDISPG